MSALSDITKRPSRKGHTKARNACQTCKRRKVKCDEKQPTCTNCARFNAPCIVEPADETPRQGRKMGRPRKDWSQPSNTPTNSSSSSGLLGIGTFVPSGTHLELLLHFATHVGPSMADPKDADDVISHFWAHNVPQLGLCFPFVSDLMFALSAHDLVSRQIHRQSELLDLADKHFSTGLAELTRLLPSLDETNCGALYISAILVFQCLLAAGPQGPDDLLICRLSDGEQYQRPWTPAIRGVRFILEKIPPDVLYSGWLEPLTPGKDKQALSCRPSYIDQDFARIAWDEPLEHLFGLISSIQDKNRSTRLKAFHLLRRIFEATYGIDGDSEKDVCPEDKFVFRWLYALDDGFIDCLRRKDPTSLLILAYYTPLLKTIKLSWRLDSWVVHLATRARDLVGEEFLEWTEWPLKAIGVN